MIIRKIMPILIGILVMNLCRLSVFAAGETMVMLSDAKPRGATLGTEEAEECHGQIQVVLPEENQDFVVHYAKVGAWTDEELFQNDRIMEELKKPIIYDGSVEVENGRVSIEHLEDGIYRMDISGSQEFEFTPALVSVPAWSDKEQKMLYEVEVIPKYIRHMLTTDTQEPKAPETDKIQSPKTGDCNQIIVSMTFGAISLIIVVIMSCHNRFRCGKMRVK